MEITVESIGLFLTFLMGLVAIVYSYGKGNAVQSHNSAEIESVRKDTDYIMTDDATKSEEIYSLIYAHGLLDVEVVVSAIQEANLDTLIKNGDDIAITLTKGGQAFPKIANLISRSNSSNRAEIQTTIISLDIK